MRIPTAARAAIWLLGTILILAAPISSGDPGERINSLLIGKVSPVHPPARWFSYEPLVEYSLVPTGAFRAYSYSIDEARRLVRIYFPRGSDLAGYDFLAFRGVFMEALVGTQIDALRSAIVSGAGAFVEGGGVTKNWAEGVNRPWVESTLASVFPNDPEAGEIWEKNKLGNLPYKVKVNQDPVLPPVLKPFLPLGVEEVRGFWYLLLIVPQRGATTWGWASGAYPGVLGGDPPWLLSWVFGEGMTWSVADTLDTPWWDDAFNVGTAQGSSSDQRYGLDILMNIVLYSLGRPLPEDVLLVNSLRLRFRLSKERTSSLYSFMDFVERFGVDSSRLSRELVEVDGEVVQAEERYIEGEYESSLEFLDRYDDAYHQLEAKAIGWKNQALLWIYIIEWAVVAATLMVAGSVVYSLMLRRRLYRQVGLTRLGSE